MINIMFIGEVRDGRKLNYARGEKLRFNFNGVYRGNRIKAIELDVQEPFGREASLTICVCKIEVLSVADFQISGKLISIEFL